MITNNLVKVKCAFCKKEFFRSRGQFNEAKKFGWKQYCSMECQKKALTTRVKRKCGNPNCHKKVLRQLNQFKSSKSGLIFCSQSCAAIVNNNKSPKRKARMEICLKCGKSFKKRGKLKYCSLKCRREAEWHTSKEILSIIRNTVQRLGRVPAKRELREIDNACRKLFGSWNNAILAAGLQPNRSHSQRMYKRINTNAIDGHLCDSVSEAIIDNWLSKNHISHKRSVSYPNTRHRTDWVVLIRNKKIFVEYFGLANDSPRYDRTIKEKKKLCRKNKIPLIAIYSQDIYPKEFLDKNLKNKFKKILAA